MRTKQTTESKRTKNHRLFYLISLPVACALLLWGGRAGLHTVARAEESASLTPAEAAPADAAVDNAPVVDTALSVASLPSSDPIRDAVANLTALPQDTVVPAPEGGSEYVIPLPCPPPADRIYGHALEGVIAFIRAGKSTETRDWVLPLLVKALSRPLRGAHITGYSSRDADGGGPYTRWGTRVRWGICAADPRYWGPGSVIWMGDPVNQVLVIEDTGGAIKGQHRFDVCTGDNPQSSAKIGRRRANYVPLYVAPPSSRWGTKPDNWRPPVPSG